MSPRRPLLASLVAALALVSLASAAAAQEGFRGEERVTAIDLVVEVGGTGSLRPRDEVPAGLSADELTVVMGGQERAIVAVETAIEPWRTVLYFDLALLTPQGLVWAVEALTPVIPRLVELGSVEITVADPEPESLLGPSGDAELITGALAQLALGDGNAANRVENSQVAVRDEVLDAIASGRLIGISPPPTVAPAAVVDPGPAPEESLEAVDPEALLQLAVSDEMERIGNQLDRLLLEMAGNRAGQRRALFYVGDGFDLDPMAFYRQHLPAAALDAATTERVEELTERTTATGRALAAYGWVTYAVAPPAPDSGLLPGVRIGKWRLRAARPGDAERWNEEIGAAPGDPARQTDPVVEGATGDPVVAPVIVLRRESDRDPDKARSYLDLASSLLAQGKLDEAEDAAERALHHFYRDPATATEQAVAYEVLGKVNERRGDLQAARDAYALAAERDPERPITAETPQRGQLINPRPALGLLTQDSAGDVLTEAASLTSVVDGLGRRLRVTYQVPGAPSGRLQPVQLTVDRRGYAVRYPTWARTATPDAVAAARLRRLLDGDLLSGSFEVAATYLPSASNRDQGQLRVTVPDSASSDESGALPETLLRVSLAHGGPDLEPTLRHDLFAPRERVDWSYSSAVELSPLRPWLAVVVEDLDSGLWGGALVERPD